MDDGGVAFLEQMDLKAEEGFWDEVRRRHSEEDSLLGDSVSSQVKAVE